MKRRWNHLAAVVVLALLGACGVAALLPNTARVGRMQELERAEALWAQRPFQQYRMEYEDFKCLQTVDVRAERVVHAEGSARCSLPARSVGELYTLIRRDGATGTRCVAQGCACDDEVVIRARYDERLGYPHEIEVRMRPRPNVLHRDYWQYVWRHLIPPACDYMEGSKLIVVHSVQPLAAPAGGP
ncbi:MAG TPA: DUF6174 domain-containing protein [Roseiflexaceae bacterium]|nr:DUF6174 domain-containing protein [Roseiflexaceae bacterium]